MPERILVVDDDPQLTSFLARFLSKQGFEVVTSGSGTQMGLRMEHQDFDLLLLDVGLPDLDGFEIVRELRKSSRVPIIFITARDEVYDKIIGLEMGGDDYVSKPFEPRELLARIRSVLRRSIFQRFITEDNSDYYYVCGLRLDVRRRVVSDRAGEEIPLTSMEFSVLKCLARYAGEIVSRDRMMQCLYGACCNVTDRAIDTHVARLRKKLYSSGCRRDMIRTVHGNGYVLAEHVRSGVEQDLNISDDRSVIAV